MGEQLQLFDDTEYIVEIDKDKQHLPVESYDESDDEEQEVEIRVLPGQLQMFRRLGTK